MNTQELLQTPLYSNHIAQKARMVPFAGWNMPLQYEGILAEYKSTREGVSLFDTSHMGEFVIEGDAVLSGFENIVTQRLVDMPLKTCRYGTMLNKEGGIIDDLIVYRVSQEKWFIVVNASDIDKKAQYMSSQLTSSGHLDNISLKTGKIDIQGPLSREVLKTLVGGVEKLEYYCFDYFDCLGENVLISRTGYTGELGFEIYFPCGRLPELWDTILKDDRVKPAGLGARDVLRLEMGYSLYGNDLSQTVTPLEAGLSKFVDFNKDFVGKDALVQQKEQGLTKTLIGFASDTRRSPRPHDTIYLESGEDIGEVTSGTFSPALTKGIGLGYARAGSVGKGSKVFIGNERAKIKAEVVPRSFYKGGSLKKEVPRH